MAACLWCLRRCQSPLIVSLRTLVSSSFSFFSCSDDRPCSHSAAAHALRCVSQRSWAGRLRPASAKHAQWTRLGAAIRDSQGSSHTRVAMSLRIMPLVKSHSPTSMRQMVHPSMVQQRVAIGDRSGASRPAVSHRISRPRSDHAQQYTERGSEKASKVGLLVAGSIAIGTTLTRCTGLQCNARHPFARSASPILDSPRCAPAAVAAAATTATMSAAVPTGSASQLNHKPNVHDAAATTAANGAPSSSSSDGDVAAAAPVASLSVAVPSSAPIPPAYFERQSLSRCALHTLNNLLQTAAFTTASLNAICRELTPHKLINPHKSMWGVGNWDVNVIMRALQTKGYTVHWFDRRKREIRARH